MRQQKRRALTHYPTRDPAYLRSADHFEVLFDHSMTWVAIVLIVLGGAYFVGAVRHFSGNFTNEQDVFGRFFDALIWPGGVCGDQVPR